MVDIQSRFFSNARPTNVRIGSGWAGMRARRPNFARMPASLTDPKLIHKKHNMLCLCGTEIQDNVASGILQDDKAVDNLWANFRLDPF